jgi:alpha,alpha-trehalose phosphorylase
VNLLKDRGIKTGVVSSSNNCAAVLREAKIESLFDIRVDGETASDLALSGKPEPDMFLEAARQLGVEPRRSIVVEDAIAGVQAGKKGGFGLVIGIARAGNFDELRKQGADLVVEDLEQLLPPTS